MASGIDALCAALRSAGVECVFGLPGTQNVELFDGFRRAGIRTVLSTHELAAAFMATGYFRASGRVAALATIPGPGFTYTLTGLAEARHDSAALLYLVGKPATASGRRFQLQAVDQRAMAAPIVKAIFEISKPSDAARVIHEAHTAALDGEPGPVMVEIDVGAIADDVAHADATPSNVTTTRASSKNADRLARAFADAERPVLLVGQGAFGVADRLARLAEESLIPVVTTPSGRGLVPEDHAMALGFDPLRGHTDVINALFDRSDLILAIGCKLGHNGSVGFSLRLPRDRFVHVDADPGVLGANYETWLPVCARAEDVVPALTRSRPSQWTPEEIASTRRIVREVVTNQVEPTIQAQRAARPVEFFEWLKALLPRDAIVVTDSGLHQILTRRYFDVLSPRGLILPSDFQSMGFGLPASIGASLSATGRPVVAIVGDGGFLMSGLELATAKRERLPLVVVVLNDGQLNQIRLQQLANFGATQAVRLENPDYEAFADAFEIGYHRFDGTPLDGRLLWNADRPILIEVVVGDSSSIRRVRRVARAKNAARRVLPTRLRDWLKRVRRGG